VRGGSICTGTGTGTSSRACTGSRPGPKSRTSSGACPSTGPCSRAGLLPSSQSAGFAGSVTGGGSVTAKTVSTAAEMQAAIDAYTGTGGLVLRYNGTFNFASITDSCAQWQKPAGAVVEIKNKSNVTIEGVDGSSANFGLAIKADAKNIIIRNMTIGLLPGSIDAIGIEGQSGKFPGYVWIDHNTLFSSTKECSGAGDLEFDGLIDSKAGAHHITYSYNHIHDHQKVGLIGSSDSDASDRYITFHHNVYQNVKSRLPLQRGGYTHLYNNLYSGVLTSGANIRMGGYSLIEANYFENAQNPVTSRDSSMPSATGNCATTTSQSLPTSRPMASPGWRASRRQRVTPPTGSAPAPSRSASPTATHRTPRLREAEVCRPWPVRARAWPS
jgi:pectate lyase